MGEKDAVEKTLFCYNDVFCDVLNGILQSTKQIIKPEELTDVVSSSTYRFKDKTRSQDRDVAKLWKNGEIRLALLGIENQASYTPDMPLRIISYDAAAYRAQLSEKKSLKRGEHRYPVVTFILNFSIRQRWKTKNLLKRLKVPKELAPFVSDYKINVIDLAWLSEEEKSYFHGEIRFVIDYLTAAREDKDFNPSEETIHHFDEFVRLLSLLSGANYDTTAEMFEESEKEKENLRVSKFMKKLFDNARAEAKAEGIAEGEARAEIKGTLITLYGLVKDGILSIQQAAERMNISVEEFQQKIQTLAM